MTKAIVTKNWQLSAAWNERRYSDDADVPEFTPPSGLSATPSGTTMSLSWTNGTASTQTRVYRSTTETGAYSLVTTVDVGVTSYDNTSLFAGTYWYKLEHVSANGSTSAQTSAVSGVIASGGSTSGGTAAFAWSAPSGVADGNSITITSNTETFAQPTKQIYLGFGMGWLYSQSDDTSFPSSLTVAGETFTQESANSVFTGRTVQTVNGRKVLRTGTLFPGASTPYGAGCLNWDTGAEITPSDVVYAFKSSRCTVGTKTGTFQWKQIRYRPNANMTSPDGNECYIPYGGSSSTWQRVDCTIGASGDVGYGTPIPIDDGWSSFGWAWRPNTVDTSDGVMYTHLVDGTRKSFARREPRNSSGQYPRRVIESDSALRPQHVMSQDYIGNVTSGSRDFVIEITDLYWKVNGDLFVLADSSDLATCTENPIPLVPTAFNSSQSWTFNLWKGEMTTYSGRYIHRLSALLEPLQVVAL